MKTIVRLFSILLLLTLLIGMTPTGVRAEVPPPPLKCPDFVLTSTHGIDGTRLGLSQELPIIVEVYLYGKPLMTYSLKFKEYYMKTLLRGDYTFKVYSVELQQYIETMQVEMTVPGCSKLGLHFRLIDGVPSTNVILKDLYPR